MSELYLCDFTISRDEQNRIEYFKELLRDYYYCSDNDHDGRRLANRKINDFKMFSPFSAIMERELRKEILREKDHAEKVRGEG